MLERHGWIFTPTLLNGTKGNDLFMVFQPQQGQGDGDALPGENSAGGPLFNLACDVSISLQHPSHRTRLCHVKEKLLYLSRNLTLQ